MTADPPRTPSVVIAAYFYEERFTRDASGTYYSTGTLPYRSFARYLKHFDRLVVVGRMAPPGARQSTVASGPGVDWACVPELPLRDHLPGLARHARDVLSRVDCAIVRLPNVMGPIACREALAAGKPWMAEVVGDAFEALWNHGSVAGKALALPVALLNRHYVQRARFAIYVTPRLRGRYPSPGAWIAASNVLIDRPRRDVLERRLARIEAGPAARVPAVGLVGSYNVRYKGHETALAALAQLRRSGRPVALRCIGVGDPARWRARAAALGLEHLVELGPVLPHGAPVLAWMDELDALIVPSLTEGLPRSLVEAMSRALPAVGSRTGGIPELLDPAWLHRPGDHRGLAARLGALLGSPEAMASQARRNWTVAEGYSADVLEARRDALVEQFKASIAARAA